MDAQAPSRGVAKVERGVPAKADNQEASAGNSARARPDSRWQRLKAKQRGRSICASVPGFSPPSLPAYLPRSSLACYGGCMRASTESPDDAFIDARTVSERFAGCRGYQRTGCDGQPGRRRGRRVRQTRRAAIRPDWNRPKPRSSRHKPNIANLGAQLDSQTSRIEQAGETDDGGAGCATISRSRNTSATRTWCGPAPGPSSAPSRPPRI